MLLKAEAAPALTIQDPAGHASRQGEDAITGTTACEEGSLISTGVETIIREARTAPSLTQGIVP